MPNRATTAFVYTGLEKPGSTRVLPTDPSVVKSFADPFNYSNLHAVLASASQRAPTQLGAPSEILVTDTISPAGDFDLFALSVVAGTTYMISVYGSGATPLRDSIVALFDDGFSLINLDDDGGAGTNSLLTFTASYTGDVFIDVEAYPGSGLTGQYTLDVVTKPAGDVVGNTFGGAVLIGEGVSYGFIDSATTEIYGPDFGETDSYKLVVEAGKYYTIEVAGGADYDSNYLSLPAGELDTLIVLYDANGDLVTFNDDINFPSDVSSKVGFFAETSGTYYLDVQSYKPWTGGFSITLDEIDLSALDPLDSINWFSADNIDVGPGNIAKVYFATAGQSFGELADNNVDPLPSFGWNAWEKQQIMQALQEYTKITGITYVETNNVADAEFRLITTTSEQYGAYFYPQDPGFGAAQGIGAFNVDSGGWAFDQQQSLTRGGFSFAVILHEFGHAHGLAHPHDTGGGSDVMAGVAGSQGSYGVFDLNQGVYTVMSYNDAYPLGPNGESPFTAAGISNGWSGSLSAFDIAVLQQRYGEHAHNGGNNVYQLKDVQAVGTYYETLWDSGGTDEIRYTGNKDAIIDLTAATLDYTATGGGVVSIVDGIFGGFTIANNVVIENATSGGGNDVLIGNSAKNILTGNGGDDVLIGRGGDDIYIGGGGKDTYVFDGAGKATINGYQAGEKIDLSAFGVTMSEVDVTKKGVFVDLNDNGTYDLFITVNGPQVLISDLILI